MISHCLSTITCVAYDSWIESSYLRSWLLLYSYDQHVVILNYFYLYRLTYRVSQRKLRIRLYAYLQVHGKKYSKTSILFLTKTHPAPFFSPAYSTPWEGLEVEFYSSHFKWKEESSCIKFYKSFNSVFIGTQFYKIGSVVSEKLRF